MFRSLSSMSAYELVIGLEIHIKLNSPTKLFCSCRNVQDFIATQPNTCICPFCSAQPGALPVLQQWPLGKALLLARALHCRINNPSQFDRKSYFYPDLPNGYQITQYFSPYAVDGYLCFLSEDFSQGYRVAIREAHLEVDSAKTIHDADAAFLDFNRAGTPLVEVVTQPDFYSADQVASFLKELQRILKYNDISDADMEKWQLRVDVNLSIRPSWDDKLYTRVELKNMNSITAIKKAIDVEYNRQVAVVFGGWIVDQETRWWDERKQDSFVMRWKEDALDYRYFPEPDLPPLHLSQSLLDTAEETSLVIPYDFIQHYQSDYGFHKEYINVLISSIAMHRYFHNLVDAWYEPKLVAKWLAGPIAAYLNEKFIEPDQLPFDLSSMQLFLDMIDQNLILDNQAKIVMADMLETWQDPKTIVSTRWFDQQWFDHTMLDTIISGVLSKNPGVVEQYKWGKETTLAFFVGQVMKETKWQIDPNKAKDAILTQLRMLA